MRNFIFFKSFLILLLSLSVCSFAAEDKLFGMNSELEKRIAPYFEKAKKTFPAIKKKYIAGDYIREKRQLNVQINLVDKDGTKEMAFIVVTWCAGNRFQGIVANDIQLLREYKYGDTVSFVQDQVKNWVVVDSLGNEEGNFVGKAIEAFDSGIVGIFFEGVYRKGKFEFKYQDAQSAKYQNSVDGIIPEKVIQKMVSHLKTVYEKRLREGEKFEEGKPFYTYGVYNIVEDSIKQ